MQEIERKFLVNKKYNLNKIKWITSDKFLDYYINPCIRLRKTEHNKVYHTWTLTIKNKKLADRFEFEFTVNDWFANLFIKNIVPIKKERKYEIVNLKIYEFNFFENVLYNDEKLTLIEVELHNLEEELTKLPEFLGDEVTYDERFYARNIINNLKDENYIIK